MISDNKLHSILIVEDDLTYAMMLKTWLGRNGFAVATAGRVSKACDLLEDKRFDIILSDFRLPDRDGTFLLPWLKKKEMDTPLIIMTRYADIRGAVQAMKDGAFDYIAKPIPPDDLLQKIHEALNRTDKKESAQTTAETMTAANTTGDYLEGVSEPARRLYDYVALVAPTPMSVLICGASGTGKEYVAHRIHQLSKRADRAFVAIDCGAIPDELAASEFFGHVKGSFTGAVTDKTGAFENADGGTIFLDEVENLSYNVQIQLLRALQEHSIRKIGASKEISVDVRVVCATNENLPEAISEGRFREDLYHRLNEFTLRMPALCERSEDIMLFANFFLDRANRELERSITSFSADAEQKLLSYQWPGNIRQLKNVINRAALLTKGETIQSATLDLEDTLTANNLSLHNIDDEKARIEEALKRTGNHKGKAALLLGIDRKTLYNKMKSYNI